MSEQIAPRPAELHYTGGLLPLEQFLFLAFRLISRQANSRSVSRADDSLSLVFCGEGVETGGLEGMDLGFFASSFYTTGILPVSTFVLAVGFMCFPWLVTCPMSAWEFVSSQSL